MAPEKKPPLKSSVSSSVALPMSAGSGPTKLLPDALRYANDAHAPRPAGKRPVKLLSLTSSSWSVGMETSARGSSWANALLRRLMEVSPVRPRTSSGMVPLRFMPPRLMPVTAPRASQRTPFQVQCGEPPHPSSAPRGSTSAALIASSAAASSAAAALDTATQHRSDKEKDKEKMNRALLLSLGVALAPAILGGSPSSPLALLHS